MRVDTACYSGCVIPPNYDSMIAKLIVKGSTRTEAIQIAKRALREFHIGGAGIATTIAFHNYMLQDENFLNSDYTITYIDRLIADGCQFVSAES